MPSSHSSGTSTTRTDIPSYIDPTFQNVFGQYGAATEQFPTLSQIPGAMPTLNIPDLTPEQQQQIQSIIAAGGSSPDLAAARQQLQQLTSGPIGSSPTTQAAMAAYRDYGVPTILQEASLGGRGTSGAALAALTQGEQQALVPLLQQEIQNRQNAVGQYGQLQGEQVQSLAAALEAAGLPREVAQQRAQAEYERKQQQLQFETGIQSLPLQTIPSLLGHTTDWSQQGHNTMDAWDWVGAGMKPAGDFMNNLMHPIGNASNSSTGIQG